MALDDGQDHHGHHDHLDQVQVNGAEGLDVTFGDVWDRLHGDAGHNADDEADGDLHGQGRFLSLIFSGHGGPPFVRIRVKARRLRPMQYHSTGRAGRERGKSSLCLFYLCFQEKF